AGPHPTPLSIRTSRPRAPRRDRASAPPRRAPAGPPRRQPGARRLVVGRGGGGGRRAAAVAARLDHPHPGLGVRGGRAGPGRVAAWLVLYVLERMLISFVAAL